MADSATRHPVQVVDYVVDYVFGHRSPMLSFVRNHVLAIAPLVPCKNLCSPRRRIHAMTATTVEELSKPCYNIHTLYTHLLEPDEHTR